MSDLASKQIERIIAGSSYPAVSSRDIKGMAFEVPDLKEQRKITEVLLDEDSEIDALRARFIKARALKTGMMQELLTGRTRLPVEATP